MTVLIDLRCSVLEPASLPDLNPPAPRPSGDFRLASQVLPVGASPPAAALWTAACLMAAADGGGGGLSRAATSPL